MSQGYLYLVTGAFFPRNQGGREACWFGSSPGDLNCELRRDFSRVRGLII